MAEINVGQISEALNDKADIDLNNVTPPYLQSRSVVDGVTVELWSDGYCVQKGIGTTTTGASQAEFTTRIEFKRNYKDTTYHINLTVKTPVETTASGGKNALPTLICPLELTTTGMLILMDANTSGQSTLIPSFYWETSGYIS